MKLTNWLIIAKINTKEQKKYYLNISDRCHFLLEDWLVKVKYFNKNIFKKLNRIVCNFIYKLMTRWYPSKLNGKRNILQHKS